MVEPWQYKRRKKCRTIGPQLSQKLQLAHQIGDFTSKILDAIRTLMMGSMCSRKSGRAPENHTKVEIPGIICEKLTNQNRKKKGC